MGKAKKLYTFIEVNDSTPIQKLSFMDQLRVLLKKLTYDDANDLSNEDAVTRELLTLKANCLEFLRKATEPIRRGERSSVVVNVSSEFEPVFSDVLNEHEIKDFYLVRVARPKLEDGLEFDFLVKLTVKKK